MPTFWSNLLLDETLYPDDAGELGIHLVAMGTLMTVTIVPRRWQIGLEQVTITGVLIMDALTTMTIDRGRTKITPLHQKLALRNNLFPPFCISIQSFQFTDRSSKNKFIQSFAMGDRRASAAKFGP